MLKKIGLLFFSLILTGCATVFSGTTQTVSVQAIDEDTHYNLPDAACTITDGKGGAYPVSHSPATVVLTRGNGALNVFCKKEGYHQASVGAGQSFNGWTIVNVLFWPGALVDAATGAIQKYPSHITVLMTKK
jgi:hypothetical protein